MKFQFVQVYAKSITVFSDGIEGGGSPTLAPITSVHTRVQHVYMYVCVHAGARTVCAVGSEHRKVMSGLQKSSSSRPQSGVVLVKDIPRGLSGEVVSQYFFSRGGEMKTFQMDENKRSALVEFEDTSGIVFPPG